MRFDPEKYARLATAYDPDPLDPNPAPMHADRRFPWGAIVLGALAGLVFSAAVYWGLRL